MMTGFTNDMHVSHLQLQYTCMSYTTVASVKPHNVVPVRITQNLNPSQSSARSVESSSLAVLAGFSPDIPLGPAGWVKNCL